MLNIVLLEPEIPENTGNIARTCVGFNCNLHLIKPYGFILSNNRILKRSSSNYWNNLKYYEYLSWEDFLLKNKESIEKGKIFLFTKKTENSFLNRNLIGDVYFVFGKETKGIDLKILENFKENNVSIPMSKDLRSFNLSNSVAMACIEYFRQNN